MQIKSYSKINLALNVVGKNPLLHKIESIVAFVSLYDEILIKKVVKYKVIPIGTKTTIPVIK